MNKNKCNIVRVFSWLISFVMLSTVTSFACSDPVDFSLPNLDAKSVHLSEFRGKWVVVNYWATWCTPCLEEIPELALFHDEHKDQDAVVLGINYEDITLPQLKKFVDNYQMTYPVLRANPAQASPLGTIIGLPTTYIISPAGELVARQLGGVTTEMIEEFMRQKPKAKKESL